MGTKSTLLNLQEHKGKNIAFGGGEKGKTIVISFLVYNMFYMWKD